MLPAQRVKVTAHVSCGVRHHWILDVTKLSSAKKSALISVSVTDRFGFEGALESNKH